MILDALHAVTERQGAVEPVARRHQQPGGNAAGRRVVPVSTGSATVLTTSNTVVNTIDYRNTGIILRVSPRINVNGNVRLDVEQEISNVPTSSPNSLTPTVSQRRVKSSISVANGQTVLLAGLISEQQNGTRNGDSGPRSDSRARRRLRSSGQRHRAHRTDHLHPPADHPRRLRCACRRRRTAVETARKHCHDDNQSSEDHQCPLMRDWRSRHRRPRARAASFRLPPCDAICRRR